MVNHFSVAGPCGPSWLGGAVEAKGQWPSKGFLQFMAGWWLTNLPLVG